MAGHGRRLTAVSGRRPASAGLGLAALVLAVAGCSHALPLGPSSAAQRHLATAIVLQTVLSQPSMAGICPTGYTTLRGPAATDPDSTDGPNGCYRKTGAPVTITSAAVAYLQQPTGNQQPGTYGVSVTLPDADRAALAAITSAAFHAQDSLATTVGGKTWSIAGVGGPFTRGQFEIPAQSAKQALQLLHILTPNA